MRPKLRIALLLSLWKENIPMEKEYQYLQQRFWISFFLYLLSLYVGKAQKAFQ